MDVLLNAEVLHTAALGTAVAELANRCAQSTACRLGAWCPVLQSAVSLRPLPRHVCCHAAGTRLAASPSAHTGAGSQGIPNFLATMDRRGFACEDGWPPCRCCANANSKASASEAERGTDLNLDETQRVLRCFRRTHTRAAQPQPALR